MFLKKHYYENVVQRFSDIGAFLIFLIYRVLSFSIQWRRRAESATALLLWWLSPETILEYAGAT